MHCFVKCLEIVLYGFTGQLLNPFSEKFIVHCSVTFFSKGSEESNKHTETLHSTQDHLINDSPQSSANLRIAFNSV